MTATPEPRGVAIPVHCPHCKGRKRRYSKLLDTLVDCEHCERVGKIVVFAGCTRCDFQGKYLAYTVYGPHGKEQHHHFCECAMAAVYAHFGLQYPTPAMRRSWAARQRRQERRNR